MGNRSAFLTCIVCCLVALGRRRVTLASVKAEADNQANDSAPPDALSQSPPVREHFSTRHHRGMGEEHGRLQPQVQEELRQRDVHSVAFTERLPSSGSACTSFLDNGESPDDDVSCFPYNGNVACRAPTISRLPTITVRDCLRRCRSLGTCSHFVWNKDTKECELKNGVPDLYTSQGSVTGPRSCKSYCYSSCVTYDMPPWKTYQLPNVPAQLCHSACWAERDTCVAWSYENGACKLFPRGFSAYRAPGGEHTVTGPRKHCEMNIDLRIQEIEDGHSLGSCLRSDDMGSRSTDLTINTASNTKECQQQCASNPRCSHYTYNRFSKVCFSKSGPALYLRYRGDVTGAKDCVPD